MDQDKIRKMLKKIQAAKKLKEAGKCRADMVRLWRAGRLDVDKDTIATYKFTTKDNTAMLSNFEGRELVNKIAELVICGVENVVVPTPRDTNKYRETQVEFEAVKYKDDGEGLTEQEQEVNSALDSMAKHFSAQKARAEIRKKGFELSAEDLSPEERKYYQDMLKPKSSEIPAKNGKKKYYTDFIV